MRLLSLNRGAVHGYRHDVDQNNICRNMKPTATAMTAVATQPSTFRRVPIANSPITFGFTAMSIITAIMGAEMTPFNTAAQYNALMGSMWLNPKPTPMRVDAAMTP